MGTLLAAAILSLGADAVAAPRYKAAFLARAAAESPQPPQPPPPPPAQEAPPAKLGRIQPVSYRAEPALPPPAASPPARLIEHEALQALRRDSPAEKRRARGSGQDGTEVVRAEASSAAGVPEGSSGRAEFDGGHNRDQGGRPSDSKQPPGSSKRRVR